MQQGNQTPADPLLTLLSVNPQVAEAFEPIVELDFLTFY
jgi:hypothetical protein